MFLRLSMVADRLEGLAKRLKGDKQIIVPSVLASFLKGETLNIRSAVVQLQGERDAPPIMGYPLSAEGKHETE